MTDNCKPFAEYQLDRIHGGADAVYQIHPLDDSRWHEFLEKHPDSSVFHTAKWLSALRLTYGYEPRVFTSTPPGADLRNGMAFCRVDSSFTGNRLVSIPSADHCEPLVSEPFEKSFLLSAVGEQVRREGLAYFDCRSSHEVEYDTSLFRSTQTYCFHQLDLGPDLETLFDNCHKSSTQRKIRRASREGLTYDSGRSEWHLDAFLRLYVLTRRRHKIPPQPKSWFRNLIDCFGDDLTIRVASKNSTPIAATLTLRYKDTVVYKYGCSDARRSNLGGTHLLFWKMIEESKMEGMRWIDLGRSDRHNPGLITFKDRWGAERSTLTYSRFAVSQEPVAVCKYSSSDWKTRLDKIVLSHLPDGALYLVGRILYPHVG